MRLFTPALFIASLTTPGLAQSDCLKQVKFPPQGRWAEYKATYKEEPYTVRYGVIGQESRGGKPLQWVEMRMQGAKEQQNMIYQVLVPGSLVEMGKVQEIVFKPGSQPAMKMSGQMVEMVRGQLNKQSFYGKMCDRVSLVGREKVTVPAGAFQALHFRSAEQASDSWVSPNVPFSLIKSSGKDYEVELVSQGQGATSSIKEKPKEMRGLKP